MQQQQGVHPPVLLTFEQTFKPKFMMRSTEVKLQQFLEEILQDHRCATHWRFLCCGNGVYRHVNHWSKNLKTQVSWDVIVGICNYRLGVLFYAYVGGVCF